MPRSPFIFCLLLLAPYVRGEAPPSGKVIERYKQMLAANPAEGVSLDRIWKIYLEQGKADELIAEYQSGGTFEREMVLGLLLQKAAQNEKAAAAFSRAAKLDAKSPLPFLALARLEDSDGHGLAAAGWYEKAIALLGPEDPRLPETLLQLGAAFLSGGEGARAAEAWERVAALRPTDLDLRRRLADAYEKNFLPTRALVHLEYIEAHAAPADRAPALQRIALIHQGAGRQDAAIAALEKALALTSPGNWLRPELESQLIRLHQRYHRTAELEARWKKFAADNPRDIGALLQLMELYERLGDLENQHTWLFALTKLAPKNVEYRLKLARLLTQMDAPEPAAAMYDELLKEQPTNSELVFERARLDMLRNDADPAVPGSKPWRRSRGASADCQPSRRRKRTMMPSARGRSNSTSKTGSSILSRRAWSRMPRAAEMKRSPRWQTSISPSIARPMRSARSSGWRPARIPLRSRLRGGRRTRRYSRVRTIWRTR